MSMLKFSKILRNIFNIHYVNTMNLLQERMLQFREERKIFMGKVEATLKPDNCLEKNEEKIVSRKNSSHTGIDTMKMHTSFRCRQKEAMHILLHSTTVEVL